MLTDEQQSIIEISKKMKPNEILRISACAGSGKTTTLIEIAKANPNNSFLYLAFNKAIVEEAKKKFPSNVDIKTIHSLAYSQIISKTKKKLIGKYNFYDINSYIPFNDFYDYYFFMKAFNDFLNSNSSLDDIGGYIRELFISILNNQLPYTHSVYLKEFQLLVKKYNKSPLDKYDFILLDEAQDTNGVTLDIFLRNNAKKILVGDIFQNIYSFKGTINALNSNNIKTNYDYSLSYSFRSTQNVLDIANYFLQKYCFTNEKFISMKSAYKPTQDIKNKTAIITRNNGTIISIINDIKTNKSQRDFKIIKNPVDIFKATMNVFAFRSRKFDRLDKEYSYLSNFTSNAEFLSYIQTINDTELLTGWANIEKHGANIFELYKEAQMLYKNNDAINILTNAHIAKGLEFNTVILTDDFVDLKDEYEKLANLNNHELFDSQKQFIEERNIYYVAITRAKEKLIDRTKNIYLNN